MNKCYAEIFVMFVMFDASCEFSASDLLCLFEFLDWMLKIRFKEVIEVDCSAPTEEVFPRWSSFRLMILSVCAISG